MACAQALLAKHNGELPRTMEELTALLARAGVNRITAPGHMSHTFPLEAHDGEYPLRRYLRVVDVEG